MIDLEETLKLFPGFYDTEVDSNIYKIMQVVTEELGEMTDVFESVAALVDINNVAGANLDLLGLDYGITRDGREDIDFRALIFAKVANFVDGNTINNIINYFSFFVPLEDIQLIEQFNAILGLFLDNTRLLDGNTLLSGAPFVRSGAFDVETGPISPELTVSFLDALKILKAGGLEANLNELPPP